LLGNLDRKRLWRRAPVSIRALLGNLDRKRLWRRAPVSIGALLGNLEARSSTGDFERWM
jgi:hypothetical protein